MILFFYLMLTTPYEKIHAKHLQLADLQNDDIHLLFIYSNAESIASPNVKKIDLLLHHFTKNIQIMSEYEVTRAHFDSATHIVYYGEHEQQIMEETTELINNFKGPIIAIGENVDQINSFQYIERDGKVNLHRIGRQSRSEHITELNYPIQIKEISYSEHTNILLYGYNGTRSYPLLVEKDGSFYFGTSQIEGELKYYLADALHDMLPNNHASEHIAYIRLEDIHPMSDPKKLLEIGEYLNERNIPYTLIVIPVYITPDTGERVYYKDSPEMITVLQYLQQTGGTVVAHGYTHQYRDSETGEGFEFWDVENGQFITSNEPKEDIESIRSKHEFTNELSYQSYIQPLKKIEQHYIEKRLEKSIHELTYYNLYPLAFEAPHYTISQQGYTITSNYFSTIFGQIQYSDENWELMGAPPYITTASYLNGMVVLPETIGYVDLEFQQPFLETSRQLEKALIVRDSMIGGFYHPYLGIEYLPKFLEQYEKVADFTWFDLKKTSQRVSTTNVQISSDGTGEIKVNSDVSWWEDWLRQHPMSLIEIILWGVTIIVFVFILLFFLFTIILRTQIRKRLFRERRTIG